MKLSAKAFVTAIGVLLLLFAIWLQVQSNLEIQAFAQQHPDLHSADAKASWREQDDLRFNYHASLRDQQALSSQNRDLLIIELVVFALIAYRLFRPKPIQQTTILVSVMIFIACNWFLQTAHQINRSYQSYLSLHPAEIINSLPSQDFSQVQQAHQSYLLGYLLFMVACITIVVAQQNIRQWWSAQPKHTLVLSTTTIVLVLSALASYSIAHLRLWNVYQDLLAQFASTTISRDLLRISWMNEIQYGVRRLLSISLMLHLAFLTLNGSIPSNPRLSNTILMILAAGIPIMILASLFNTIQNKPVLPPNDLANFNALDLQFYASVQSFYNSNLLCYSLFGVAVIVYLSMYLMRYQQLRQQQHLASA